MNIVVDQGRIFRTLDLSREGMRIEMSTAPQPGARLMVDLQLGEHIVEVKGEVMRVEILPDGKAAVGLRFDRMTPRAERSLLDYLHKKSG
jgi:c-di-GMP-binding flagellar brake protein YcgR